MCEDELTKGAGDTRVMRLSSPIKTSWNSVPTFINKNLELKVAITRFSQNEVEVDERIDGEDDDDMSARMS